MLRTVATVLHLKSVKICLFDIITPTNSKPSYNSTIFPYIPFAIFPIALVIDDFLASPDVWSATKLNINSSDIFDLGSLSFVLYKKGRNFTYLNNTQCVERYIGPLGSTGELPVVSTSTATENNGSSLLHRWITGNDPPISNIATGLVYVAHENADYSTWCESAQIP